MYGWRSPTPKMKLSEFKKLIDELDDDLSICVEIDDDYWSPGETYSVPIKGVDKVERGYERKFGEHLVIKMK